MLSRKEVALEGRNIEDISKADQGPIDGDGDVTTPLDRERGAISNMDMLLGSVGWVPR